MAQGDSADFGNLTRTVYIRHVDPSELPEEVLKQLPKDQKLFGLHDTSGERLALVSDYRAAFVLARRNDLSPVHVH